MRPREYFGSEHSGPAALARDAAVAASISEPGAYVPGPFATTSAGA